ncbi:MAG: molybdopterin molybdotransferase MoeA [Acidobacteriota bacterium]|jgi:molybdopterin molybdotransferase|nr:molybdopterin molybdotransferase MoeA [Acidobacteriota bacterium]
MPDYETAVKLVLENTPAPNPARDAVKTPLSRCLGMVCAEDVSSGIDLPQRASCGPDGYALHAEDIAAASKGSPVTLRIGETVRAGVLPRRAVARGEAARVMTGSVLPRGADCVVRFEDTDEPSGKSGPNPDLPATVRFFVPAAPGSGVTPAGAMLKRKSVLLPKGTPLGPAQVSALIAVGRTEVKAFRKPVVAVIATGDELVAPGRPLRPGKTYNSNASALAAAITRHGGVPKLLGVARDDKASVLRKITQGLECDAIVTSGGASKGDYDLVRLVLGELGEVVFATLDIAPGRAAAFGVARRKGGGKRRAPVPVFVLAGPPTGCLINFETLALPALKKMSGRTDVSHPEVEAVAADSFAVKGPFSFAIWSQLEKTGGGYAVRLNPAPSGAGGAGFLAAMAASNALAILPRGADVKPGDKVRVLPVLGW